MFYRPMASEGAKREKKLNDLPLLAICRSLDNLVLYYGIWELYRRYQDALLRLACDFSSILVSTDSRPPINGLDATAFRMLFSVCSRRVPTLFPGRVQPLGEPALLRATIRLPSVRYVFLV